LQLITKTHSGMVKNLRPHFFICMRISYLRNISFFLFGLVAVMFSASCSKTATPQTIVVIPTVGTIKVIENLTDTSAQSGGVVISAGNGAIKTNGVCYSATDQTPTTADSKTSDSVYNPGTSVTAFTSHLHGLTPGTKYYLRGYATNSAGTGYGSVVTFTTLAANAGTNIVAVSTFAGTGIAGYMDGPSSGAQFNNPAGITVDSKGNIYVSDTFNDLIREISPAGNVTTIAGNQSPGLINGTIPLSTEFYAPSGQVVDAQGNLYVSDQGNNVIRKITPAGVVTTFAGTGQAGYRNGAVDSAHLTGTSDSLARFNSPQGLCIDGTGNIYVADRGNNVIREIMPNGRTKTIAGNKVKGFIDATDEAAFFDTPTGVAVDSKGNVWVTDQGNSALREISSSGVVTTIFGSPAQQNLLGYPAAITIDTQGNLYIADESGRIFEYTTGGVLYLLAGALNATGLNNGPGGKALFNYPQSIAIDASGNIYVADQYNNCIRKITIAPTI
jgi:sugar lactone lactonase YvrE